MRKKTQMPSIGFPHSHSLHQATATCLLGICVLFLDGCADQRRLSNPPSNTVAEQTHLNAYTLSGGKITQFVSTPGLPNNPVDISMLEACRQIPLKSTTARHAYIIVHGRGKIVPVSALVIGKTVLVTLGEVTRVLGITTTDNDKGGLTLFPGSAQSIITEAGNRKAIIGNETVTMIYPMYWANNGGLVLTLPDIQKLFNNRAVQRGTISEFNVERIVYQLSPDMKFNN